MTRIDPSFFRVSFFFLLTGPLGVIMENISLVALAAS